ncbi:MAG TPA: hypothetical protein VN920_17185 [Pyrinomonadaceae bacterium]|nr:hypothetical protein [Pyrinomonadaceae bacterium]
MKTLAQKIEDIDPARRKRVEARAAALVAEEMTLQEIRQAASRGTTARKKHKRVKERTRALQAVRVTKV